MKNPLKKIVSLGKKPEVVERGTKVCQSCGKSFPLDLNFCQDCGIQLTEAVIKVPKEGSPRTVDARPQQPQISSTPQRPGVQQPRSNPVRPSLRAPAREQLRSEAVQTPQTRRFDPEIGMIKDSVEKMHKIIRDNNEMLEEIRRDQQRLSTDVDMIMEFLRIFNESARNTLSRSAYESKERV